jgi:hypothetical protein
MMFYLSEGKEVFGPLSASDVLQFCKSLNFQAEKWQVCDQTHQWKAITKGYIDELEKITPPKGPRIIVEDPGTGPEQTPGNHTPEPKPFVKNPELAVEALAKIRGSFQQIWEKQVERIISLIKNEEAKREHEVSVKEFNAIRDQINNHIIQFWRTEGTLNDWIADLTWGEPGEVGDYFFSLKGQTPEEKMNEVKDHLLRTKIEDLEGCYCFMDKDEKYLYIGQTTDDTLKQRILTGHNGKTVWIETRFMRILIPRHMKQAKKIERLLILANAPAENKSAGHKNSKADEVFEIIRKELEELTQV